MFIVTKNYSNVINYLEVWYVLKLGTLKLQYFKTIQY